VKFGISFTLLHLNQAGALVHVYQDGSATSRVAELLGNVPATSTSNIRATPRTVLKWRRR